MNLLFVHQNLPAQFEHLMRHYAKDGRHKVVGICQRPAPVTRRGMDGVALRVYAPHRRPTEGVHRYLYSTEAAVLNGQGIVRELAALEAAGFRPDVAVVHSGWGEGLYVKDMLPDTPLLSYCEFFYRSRGADVNFDPEFPVTKDDELRLRTRNAVQLLTLDACDTAITPTAWQKSVYPVDYHHKLHVIHEGVDTGRVRPRPDAVFRLPGGRCLRAADEIVTFVARSLEPYRGFHVFMRALPKLLQRRPDCQVVILGDDDVSYGRPPADGGSWRDRLLDEVGFDRTRVHFPGKVPWPDYLALLQVSTVHCYLTVPFVLSWSMLEAMAAGVAVVGSDTAPVREVIEHGENGLLVDFFSTDALADAVDRLCDDAALRQRLGAAARDTVMQRFDVTEGLQRYDGLIRQMTGQAVPG